jgi:hypothetical protein
MNGPIGEIFGNFCKKNHIKRLNISREQNAEYLITACGTYNYYQGLKN